MEVRVHPKFKEILGVKVISNWPRKNELWVCYDTDVNFLNGAKHLILTRSGNPEKDEPYFYLEGYGIVCYNLTELLSYLNGVDNFRPILFSPVSYNTYCLIGNDFLKKKPLT